MAQATWSKVAVVAPLAIGGMLIAPVFARRLDLLALGDRPARHLGVDVDGTCRSVLLLVAVLTASAVAVSGQILFVGLVIPHIVRMVAGPGHRLLVPASALAGATILVGADLAARTIAAPAEIPLGVLTALVGSPFFFWQLRRTAGQAGRLGVRLAERLGPRPPRPRRPDPSVVGEVALEARRVTVEVGDGRAILRGASVEVAGWRGRRPGRSQRRRQVHPRGRAQRRRRADSPVRWSSPASPSPTGPARSWPCAARCCPSRWASPSRSPCGRWCAWAAPRGSPSTATPTATRWSMPAWPGPTSPTSPTAPSRPCRAASGRGPPSPGCWPRTRACSCSTSRPPRSTCTTRRWCSRLARERATVGVAVVVVLHDLGLAAAHADRIVVLDGGEVVVDGPPAEVLRPALLSEVYRHPVEVLPHPRTGELIVLPVRLPTSPECWRAGQRRRGMRRGLPSLSWRAPRARSTNCSVTAVVDARSSSGPMVLPRPMQALTMPAVASRSSHAK